MEKNARYVIDYKKIIKYIMFYFILTIMLFDFGPHEYKIENGTMLHFYILSYFFAFYLGYKVFSKRSVYEGSQVEGIREKNTKRIEKILKKGIYINLILVIIFCLVSTNSSTILVFFNKIMNGIKDPATSYYDKVYNSTLEQGANLLRILFMFIYPYMLSILVLAVYNLKRLNLLQKIVTGITIILEMSRWIAVGTNKGVFDILILFISFYLISLCLQKFKDGKKIKNKVKLKYKLLIILLGITIFSMFTYFISSRMYVDNEGISIVERAYYGIEKITNYLVQGYKGMDYALNLEWKPTFGVGNSVFLTAQVDKMLGTNFSEMTYAKRAEIYGWSSTVNWHTAYTWFANDIHFLGIIVLMFFIGAFLACLIKEIVIYNNYYSTVLFYMIIVGIFYSSANNQVLAFSDMFIAFWVLFILRYLKVRKDKQQLNG